jgi:xanthine dehydrogenase accessory factor
MRELQDIVAAARRAFEHHESPVLATVVSIRGSSYRKPGAMMLVTESGWKAGSVSGGCLERELVRRAHWLTQSGPVIETYDTSHDAPEAAGSLGCGGIIHIILEPLTPQLIEDFSVTTIARKSQYCAISLAGDTIGKRTFSPVVSQPSMVPETDTKKIFLQVLKPNLRLVIVGAGHDSRVLASLAALVGFDVHVVDFRAHFLELHDNARTHLIKASELHLLPVEPGCAVVVMSHHLEYDAAALEALTNLEGPNYLGVMGPRRRTAQLLENAKSPKTSRRGSLRVLAPVGFDLGGEGPHAVALSIVAEIHAVLNGASGLPLHLKSPVGNEPA